MTIHWDEVANFKNLSGAGQDSVRWQIEDAALEAQVNALKSLTQTPEIEAKLKEIEEERKQIFNRYH